MIIAFKTNNAKFIALNLVFLLLSPTAFAQNAPGTTSTPNGEIFLIRPAQNSQLNPGELEVISGGAAPLVVTQSVTGPTFLTLPAQISSVNILQTLNSQVNPGEREVISGGATPRVFTQSLPGLTSGTPGSFVPTGAASGALSGGVYTIGGGAGVIDLNSYILAENYNNAIYAATTACSSGTQAACDGALRTLVAATLARYAASAPAVLQNEVLISLRQVVSIVNSSPGAAGSRAINIATIDAAFARAFPESTRTRPSSPS